MEKTFDFEKIGKRMPYTVPDDFFDRMEENIMESLTPCPSPARPLDACYQRDTRNGEASDYSQNTKTVKADITPLSHWRGAGVRLLFAVAAAIALFFVVRTTLPKSEPVLASANDFESVEMAFNNLSSDDQDFLIQVYEDEDILMNDFEFNL